MNESMKELNRAIARHVIKEKQIVKEYTNKKEPKVLTRMRLSCCWGDNLNEKELNEVVDYINWLQQKVNQLEEENRKLINNKYDTIYLIQDLACYDRETNSYCDSIKYYDVHKIIEELEGGSNE